MKKAIFSCLLGMGFWLHGYVAMGEAKTAMRTIDVVVNVEEEDLTAWSDAGSGSITLMEIFNASNVRVLSQVCGGYTCSMELAALPAGSYTVVVYTSRTSYAEGFVLY